ncbi:hypothetical protein CC86DRAFT_403765 [Ophiobolus disseminans]|uniref:Nucleoplasmin-like domain-containing protein n=1 Tax=Ophiobolus disseminans TaxID=1469910 RepID=A0A6A7A8P1_9PLEO|nr:hypothetical protein CC86DRAFT_403765 [Ophiobolus disseminans]
MQEYSALPTFDPAISSHLPIDYETIESGSNTMCNMRLKVGVSNGEFTDGLAVYLCISGEGSNQITLNCDDTVHKFSLNNLVMVQPELPFNKLCPTVTDPKINSDAERQRLRAVQPPDRPVGKSDGHVHRERPATPLVMKQERERSHGLIDKPLRRKRIPEMGSDHEADEPPHKKKSSNNVIVQLRQMQDKTTADIVAIIDKELASHTRSTHELQTKLAQQATEIGKLKEQLTADTAADQDWSERAKAGNREIDELRLENDKLQTARREGMLKIAGLEDEVENEKAAKETALKREAASDKKWKK